MKLKAIHTSQWALMLLIGLVAHQQQLISGQFLFTYEINQESDDSRAPKSSLFDPSSFRIVTPSQLQSNYQKIASQAAPVEEPALSNSLASGAGQTVPASLGDEQPTTAVHHHHGPQQIGSQPEESSSILSSASRTPATGTGTDASAAQQQPASLLKQTSAALQSFAELFSLAPSSSPAPLGSLSAAAAAAAAATSAQQHQVDQQAEARSLHEHWSQQQQKAHQQQPGTTIHLGSSQQPANIANAALNSFTTSQPGALAQAAHQSQQQSLHSQMTSHHQHQHQHPHQHQSQQSPASYWLTSSPLNSPDGNYLVQIKQQRHHHQETAAGQQAPAVGAHQQQPPPPQLQVTSPASLVVDNLLSMGQQRPAQSLLATSARQQQQQQSAKAAANLAQSSFLSTPTSYYPGSAVESSAASRSLPTGPAHPHQHVGVAGLEHSSTGGPFVSAPSAATAPLEQHPSTSHQRAQASFVQQAHSTQSSLIPGGFSTEHTPSSDSEQQLAGQQLQPPANVPDNFVAPVGPGGHKSAEESLIAFRKQQHDHYASPQQQQQRPAQQVAGNQFARQTYTSQAAAAQQQPARSSSAHLTDIPKVSPQIYESFLFQQRDQHEKHMELLKQQQELNKLMEQKHKQQEAESKRRRKKEELDKEARKKAQRELEMARKLKLEQEERETRRRREQAAAEQEAEQAKLEERRQQEVLERKRIEEQRRYREFLEARERERREREREIKLKREEEAAREAKAKLERERELSELAERRRLAEVKERERREKEAEEAKYLNYLRQREELKKLLELKEKEDEAQQQRRKQAVAQQQRQQQAHSQSSRAGRLAQEHKERGASSAAGSSQAQAHAQSSWGLPIRARAASTLNEPSPASLTQAATATTTPQAPASSEPPSRQASSTTAASAERRAGRASARQGYLVKKQRVLGDAERLVRQKIPLYSGPGQYGLYRNESLANDLAALLDSVTLPSPSSSTGSSLSSQTSTTTTTTTTTSTTPAPESEASTAARRSQSEQAMGDLSSLSPLLNRGNSGGQAPATASMAPAEPFFDDDVPRRPTRGLSARRQQQHQQVHSAASSTSLATSTLASGPLTRETVAPAPSRRFNDSHSSPSASASARPAAIGLASLPPDTDNDGIPGRAGVEYPVLSAVPPTSFSCSKQPLNGYYADTETACQVVHLCQGGAQSSILCPNGTIFNQEKFSCQWWYEVNCSRAPIFYQLNDNLYKSLPGSGESGGEGGKRKLSSRKPSAASANLLAAASSSAAAASSASS